MTCCDLFLGKLGIVMFRWCGLGALADVWPCGGRSCLSRDKLGNDNVWCTSSVVGSEPTRGALRRLEEGSLVQLVE